MNCLDKIFPDINLQEIDIRGIVDEVNSHDVCFFSTLQHINDNPTEYWTYWGEDRLEYRVKLKTRFSARLECVYYPRTALIQCIECKQLFSPRHIMHSGLGEGIIDRICKDLTYEEKHWIWEYGEYCFSCYNKERVFWKRVREIGEIHTLIYHLEKEIALCRKKSLQPDNSVDCSQL